MKISITVVATLFTALQSILAADQLAGTLNMGFRDMSVVKQKAEAGDSAAQVYKDSVTILIEGEDSPRRLGLL